MVNKGARLLDGIGEDVRMCSMPRARVEEGGKGWTLGGREAFVRSVVGQRTLAKAEKADTTGKSAREPSPSRKPAWRRLNFWRVP